MSFAGCEAELHRQASGIDDSVNLAGKPALATGPYVPLYSPRYEARVAAARRPDRLGLHRRRDRAALQRQPAHATLGHRPRRLSESMHT